jgi:hypothetical protein
MKTLNVKNIGSNMIESRIGLYVILVSYETPVAYIDASQYPSMVYRTSKWHSATTTKHINKWLRSKGYEDAIEVEQSVIDKLLKV